MAVNTTRITATGTAITKAAAGRSTLCVSYFILTGDSAAAKAIIRETDGSGAIVLTITAAINTTIPVPFERIFNTDVHVTLSGAGAELVTGWC